MRTRIGDRAIIEDSLIMGSDIYQVRVAKILLHLIFAYVQKSDSKCK